MAGQQRAQGTYVLPDDEDVAQFVINGLLTAEIVRLRELLQEGSPRDLPTLKGRIEQLEFALSYVKHLRAARRELEALEARGLRLYREASSGPDQAQDGPAGA